MTHPDPNETARIPTPSEAPPTDPRRDTPAPDPWAPESASAEVAPATTPLVSERWAGPTSGPAGSTTAGASDPALGATPGPPDALHAVPPPPAPAPAAAAAVPPPSSYGTAPAGPTRDAGTAARTPAGPGRRLDRSDPGQSASVVFGLVLLAIGGWFFADQTLGLDLPTLRWSQLWPLILIAVGVWIVLGSMRRGSR